MIKEVFLIFKTHLDIGFTDYAENVVRKYIEQYIPAAINVGYELKNTDTPFVWTVGSWLVWEALKKDESKVVEQAIKDGIITWHALPFTTHTELMSEKLFQYGLSLSEKLDQRFGKKTIASKMTDVPGHTIAMVPLMKNAGVEFLHIGVNPATPLPKVPPLFRWRYGEDEIMVMYQGDYGVNAEFDDFAICFGHTNDNCGPQSKEKIIEQYENLRKMYPQAEIKAATLDDIAKKLNSLENIPVIDKEIGDTWIHGAATDPMKVRKYRELLRCIETRDIQNVDLADNLLVVPEHTWGMDIKTFFPDTANFMDIDFTNPDIQSDRKTVEKAWQEQRNYVVKAEETLQISSNWGVQKPDLRGWKEIDNIQPMFEISWQLFDNSDYDRYKKVYLRSHVDWAILDFTKVGLDDYKGGVYTASVTRTWEKNGKYLFKAVFERDISQMYGLPSIYAEMDGEDISIKWFDKKPSRLPQAFWVKFTGFEENWEIRKMGRWINPKNVIGSPLICATDYGVKNKTHEIVSLDAALVAPFGRRLLDLQTEGLENQDLYFNLYNNIWNTNFPMWYSEDTEFRFKIKETIRLGQ